ncbi:MAG: hypothetical protein ACE5GO_02690 [Anaerolineales bacterium]
MNTPQAEQLGREIEALDIRPQQVYDNRLGRDLDWLYPHLGELWAQLASQAIQTYALDLNVLHWDITFA